MHKHNSKHMWWMLAGCIGLPLLLLTLWGSGAGSGLNRNWLLFGVLALCVGSHIAMMFGGHGSHAHNTEEKTDGDKELLEKEKGTHGGCCH